MKIIGLNQYILEEFGRMFPFDEILMGKEIIFKEYIPLENNKEVYWNTINKKIIINYSQLKYLTEYYIQLAFSPNDKCSSFMLKTTLKKYE